MRKCMSQSTIALLVLCLAPSVGHAISVTGDPLADGWTYGGYSLQQGVYVRGDANFGYDVYSTSMTIMAGSILEISGGSYPWQVGDTVLGVGGRFATTPSDLGWAGPLTGGAVNALLANATGPKLQVKFGTDNALWTVSTSAPSAGNGAGSLTYGGDGSLQMRTSAYNTATFWSSNAGQLLPPASQSHVDRYSASSHTEPNLNVGRIIWNYDSSTGEVASWELLLNVSLLARLQPTFPGSTPGGWALLTVQDGDNKYTDALVRIAPTPPIPEPATLSMLGLCLGGLAVRRLRSRR